MKKILMTLLSVTLSYSSFASLGPDTEVPSIKLDSRIQLDDKLSDDLKAVQGDVFFYSEQTGEFFRFDRDTETAFKSSEEEYQTALFPFVAGVAILVGSGSVYYMFDHIITHR